jgi:hypothetical protein
MKIEKTSFTLIQWIAKLFITLSFLALLFLMYLKDGQPNPWVMFILGLIVAYWFKR